MINGAKDFAEYANKVINSIYCLYLAEYEIMAEPQDIKMSPKIPKKFKDHEVCRHNQLPLSYEIDQTYSYCKKRFKGNEEWIQCKLCNQWFHEACFEK